MHQKKCMNCVHYDNTFCRGLVRGMSLSVLKDDLCSEFKPKTHTIKKAIAAYKLEQGY